MSQKDKYQNILLAALGTTPQIITESMYYLMVIENIMINEIHFITTTEGKKKADNLLFNNGKGPYYQFFQEYNFISTEVLLKYHVINDPNGDKLSDIRTLEDNRAAANYFLKVARELTSRDDTRIFATIAGGRKTMSAYLYLVMLLLGRDQDSIYHVLVQPENIESNPAFYFPLKNVKEMQFKDKKGKQFIIPVSNIRIDMAQIPFVRLRRFLQKEVLDNIDQFYELIEITQNEMDKAQFEPNLEVNFPMKEIVIYDRQETYHIKLSPKEMCLYAYLCQKGSLLNSKKENEEAKHCMAKIHKQEYSIAGVNKNSFNYRSLQEMRSNINKKIRKKFFKPGLKSYVTIDSDGKYGGATYSISLSKNKISYKYTSEEIIC